MESERNHPYLRLPLGMIKYGKRRVKKRLPAGHAARYNKGKEVSADMDMVAVIARKRDGLPLTREMIDAWVAGVISGEIPDYQSTSLLMAIRINGMDAQETAWLTQAMSGNREDMPGDCGVLVDKHSSGGVGDGTTLIAVPLAAACGARIFKMSGRGLGHTGGTLDKLAAIPGFDALLPREDALRVLREAGAVVIGQSEGFCPADKALYALRDVSGTVDSLPLIASSIMSKKLASGCKALVLDVKVGSGALLPEHERALELAQAMIDIAEASGLRCAALLTDMSQPLGCAVGNALEVAEAAEILLGADGALCEVSIELAAAMIALSTDVPMQAAREAATQAWRSGAGAEKLEHIIALQGGDPRVVRDPGLLPRSERVLMVRSPEEGWVSRLDARAIGEAARLLGAGRLQASDVIDPAAGILLKKRVGDHVNEGEILMEMHSGLVKKGRKRVPVGPQAEQEALQLLGGAVDIGKVPTQVPPVLAGALNLPA